MRPRVTAANCKFLLLALILCYSMPRAAEPKFTQVEVYRSGQDGYHTYRIPSLITTQKGTLLAFCEGRKNSASDTGDVDMVLKRSFDQGKTWTKQQTVADYLDNAIDNPCPVIDRETGTIWLLLSANPGAIDEKQIIEGTAEGTRTAWLTKSTDDGATWSTPVEITRAVKDPDWTWYATGPGNGIQLKTGRLVIPCNHADKATRTFRSHVIYSDDHGKTWKIGGTLGEKTDESQVVELADGSLLINMRSSPGVNRRWIARSRDEGLTWSATEPDPALLEPACQASFIRYTERPRFSKNRLLFSNPADVTRVKLTVRLSYDEGETWPVTKLINPGPSAYSSLAVLPDSTIGCLYERGVQGAYESITFARFNLEWLTDKKDRLP